MPDPLKVLWFTKGLGRGGVERLIVSSMLHVDRMRFDVEVAYVLPWKDAFVPDLERSGVRTHCIGKSGRFDVTWPWRLRRLVRDGGFDLVHTHMPLSAAIARLVLPRRVKLVHTEHNVWKRHRLVTRCLNSLTIGRNSAVLAVSHAVADSIRPPRVVQRHMPPVEVVLHGPDMTQVQRGPEARTHARRLLGLPDDARVVGSVGNFTPKKDQRTMLRAIARLAPSLPDLRLVLIGSGPLDNELRQLAGELGIDQRMVFTGSRDDVAVLLPAFDVFSLSSLHEGLSIALLEAMASGVACVSTRAGGIVEVLEHEVTGLLVPPADQRALADALARVLDDDDLRAQLAEAGRIHSADFDLARAVHDTQVVYERAMASR